MSASPARDADAIARRMPRVKPLLSDLLRGVRGESLAPLLLALGCEVPVLAVRSVLIYIGCGALLLFTGQHGGPWESELALLAPIAWPAVALLVPFPSGWWWRHAEGGRAPSQREQLAYQDSIATLQAHAPGPLRLPAGWFVLDSPYPDAAVCADTLMLSRGLLEGEHLNAVLAHELGHLATGDGRLTAAINRLLILRRPKAGSTAAAQAHAWPAAPMLAADSFFAETILLLAQLAYRGSVFTLRLARGGCGLRLTASIFGAYWRAREYEADAYAAMLGQAEELADFLEAHALIHDQPIPFAWLKAHTHPPAELRIDRLRGAIAEERS